MGGQLQRWQTGEYDCNGSLRDLKKPNEPAIKPRARLKDNMLQFDENLRQIDIILDENGDLIKGGDLSKKIFLKHRYIKLMILII